MKSTEIYEILRDYTAGKEGLEETNAALREAGAGFHLTPGRNVLSDAERRETDDLHKSAGPTGAVR